MSDLRIYNIMTPTCSCRDENDNLTPVGERYKEFYELVKNEGYSGVAALDKMRIFRHCCRNRFLSPSREFMIDRSSKRIVDTNIGKTSIHHENRTDMTKPYFEGTKKIEIKVDFP